MARIIVSSVGTSLLTRHAEKAEREALIRCSNLRKGECPPDVTAIVQRLHEEALKQLDSSDIAEIRRASAELNGLVGLNGGRLPTGAQQEMHFLIATDTAQGQATAETVAAFLRDTCGCMVEVFVPQGLSTQDEEHFSGGIKHLLKWCDMTLEGYHSAGYEIVFNLTGGFKSLQGYLNTIGMFYADRMVYIFESATAELIEIPRLPVAIDLATLEQNATAFALLDAGRQYRRSDFPDVPESLLDELDGDVLLSVWGELIWKKAKYQILGKELLLFPRLNHADSFRRDFADIRQVADKVRLQETLAKVSVLLERSSGSTAPLKGDGGVQYEDMKNMAHEGRPIGHFRITNGLRASCIAVNGALTMRHYGSHDYVNNNP